jgi:hypothetical protein
VHPPKRDLDTEKIYKTLSYGKWKYVPTDSITTKWDPSNLPEPGTKRKRASLFDRNKVNFMLMLQEIKDNSLKSLQYILSATSNPDNPTFQEAMSSDNRASWIAAIVDEYKSLSEKKVFGNPCKLPKGFKTLDTKMVLKLILVI